jgi:5-methylcytosine-specific restriction endonuclease McrA
MTSLSSPSDLSDRDLLAEVARAVSCEREANARLIALLMEVDSRKLYAGQGYASLFTYCVQALHLSEHAAYLRIEAARVVRRFPAILDKLSNGSLHLTAVSLLGPHLTLANHVELLAEARHKSKREIEQLIARLRPQPDVPSIVRKLPAPKPAAPGSEGPRSGVPVPGFKLSVAIADTTPPAMGAPVAPRPEIKPLAPERYKVQCTVSRETHDKLRRVQDLLRHAIPDGDLAAILDRALTVLLADLSRAKCAATNRSRSSRAAQSRSRYIPAAVKRDVWARDGGRCAFQGERGRCAETGFLEFHHVVPYADGGETSATNLELRCRAHNQYEAALWSGATEPPLTREARASFGA